MVAQPRIGQEYGTEDVGRGVQGIRSEDDESGSFGSAMGVSAFVMLFAGKLKRARSGGDDEVLRKRGRSGDEQFSKRLRSSAMADEMEGLDELDHRILLLEKMVDMATTRSKMLQLKIDETNAENEMLRLARREL